MVKNAASCRAKERERERGCVCVREREGIERGVRRRRRADVPADGRTDEGGG